MLFYIYVAFFAPLVSFIFAGLFFNSKKSLFVAIISTFLIVASTICSFMLFEVVVRSGHMTINLGDFITIGGLNFTYSLLLDQLSVVMMSIVGIVASVVHIYSIGYMEDDRGFNKFFSYLGLFVFSMLFLVTSDNFIGLFIGWEGVGLSSWLLIGFWYERKNVSWCANEAFIMNRVADLGLLVGIFAIYVYCGTVKFSDFFFMLDTLSSGTLLFIAIALFIGAMGKSAQFPFHTWLADAMAGPTPVSALIHAATMVTAGVYLVVRVYPLYMMVPEISAFIAYLGTFVALFGASLALVCRDLKKIIAYSTLSQLGYMFVAAGIGAYGIAIFHLATHAFFKSLLFLGAGNIMHSTKDELNIFKMGAFYNYLRPTALLMMIASLALVGIYPFAGFFSKDQILEAAFGSNLYYIWAALLVGAIFTAFYSTRLIMVVFFGERKLSFEPKEVKNFMLISLTPLALLSIIAGWFGDSFLEIMAIFLPELKLELTHKAHYSLIALTLFLVIATIFFAIYAYKKELFGAKFKDNFIYRVLINQYYIPHFYDKFVVKPYYALSRFCAAVDSRVIDKFVDGLAKFIMEIGTVATRLQSGNLSSMIRLMVIGFFIFLLYILVV